MREKFNPWTIANMPAEDPEPLIGAVKFFAFRISNNVTRSPLGAHPFPDGNQVVVTIYTRKATLL
jgi:hypothetical protein